MSLWGDIAGGVGTMGILPAVNAVVPGGLFGTPQTNHPGGGVIGKNQAAGYVGQGADLSQQPIDQGLQDYLRNLLMNPNYGPQTQNQQNLVNQLYSGRQAQFNNLGIGDSPAAQTSIAAAAAPTLVGLNQNSISNIAQFIQLLQQQRQLQTGGLYGAANFGKAQGQVEQGAQPGAFQLLFGNDGLFGGGGGGAAGAAKAFV